MRALVLSGCKGTRLRPITHTFAKQLIPVANKPILFYGLEAIAQAGIREVGIVVGETREEIQKAVGDGSAWGLKVTYIPQEEPLGLAHAVKISRDFLQEESFVMYLGDNLIKEGITHIVQDFEKFKPNAQILVAHVPHPEQFGVVELKDGKAVRLEEKPKNPKSTLASTGIYVFPKKTIALIKKYIIQGNNPDKTGNFIEWLHKRDVVYSYATDKKWYDIGTIDQLKKADKHYRQK